MQSSYAMKRILSDAEKFVGVNGIRPKRGQ
jgi:hypothetical protein